MTKKLIINADDYGISREVNDAIENLIIAGKLHNVSVISNAWFYNDASAFLQKHSHVSVGIHLNVVEGIAVSPTEKVRPLMGKHGQFVNIDQLFRRWLLSPFAVNAAVEIEWRSQIELLLGDRFEITHADSHQHVHAFPPFWKILTRLCREYGIPGLRSSSERNGIRRRRLESYALRGSAYIAAALNTSGDLVVNDHFLGFKRAGGYGEAEMSADARDLKVGVTELACHPSLYADVPYAGYRGDLEYKALSGTAVWGQIKSSAVELTTWRSFTKR